MRFYIPAYSLAKYFYGERYRDLAVSRAHACMRKKTLPRARTRVSCRKIQRGVVAHTHTRACTHRWAVTHTRVTCKKIRRARKLTES
jgi:hypothetical protein